MTKPSPPLQAGPYVVSVILFRSLAALMAGAGFIFLSFAVAQDGFLHPDHSRLVADLLVGVLYLLFATGMFLGLGYVIRRLRAWGL